MGVVPFYRILGIFDRGWWHYAGYVYVVVCIGIGLLFAKWNRWTVRSLGLRTDNIKSAVVPYTVFTGCWVIAIVAAGSLWKKGFDPQWFFNTHLTGMFLVSAALQQFFFSSLLIRLQQEIFRRNLLLILYNALIFSLIHLSFDRHAVMITCITYVLGLGFATMYLRHTNYFLVTLSHAIINATGILFIYG